MSKGKVKCKVCGKKFKQIPNSHLRTHNMTTEEYKEKYPDAKFLSDKQREKISKSISGENHPMYGKKRPKHSERMKGKNSPNYKRIKVKCDYCGKEFYEQPARITNHNFCSKKCYNNWKGRKITKVCEECGKEFKVYPSKKDRKFCSKECYHKRYRGENHPDWKSKVSIKCNYCGKEFKVIPSRKNTARFCSRECYYKYLSKHSEDYIPNSEESKKKKLRSLMEKPTKPEKKVIEIIKRHSLPFKYTGDGEKIIGKLNPDFIHNGDSKKLIEVFGDTFHNPEKSFKENIPWYQQEFGRKAYFSQRGYDCLVLWGSDIREMSEEEIASRIKEFIE